MVIWAARIELLFTLPYISDIRLNIKFRHTFINIKAPYTLRFLVLLILLAFPIAEIWGLIKLAQIYGWWLLVYLIVVSLLGVRLIIEEKSLIMGRLMQGVMQGGSVGRGMFGGAKNMIAGVLLIIPGVITDVIAIILLLMATPVSQKSPKHRARKQAANDDVIEGEYTRED